MKKTTSIRFTVRNKGGNLSGKIIEREVPDFDWDAFKKCPNASEFAKKVYFQAVRRIAREEESQQVTTNNLQSIESILTNSLSYTKTEILEWISSRNWECAKFNIPTEQAIDILKKKLPKVLKASDTEKNRLAEIIASVADKHDPVAEYLFSCLTIKHPTIEASDL